VLNLILVSFISVVVLSIFGWLLSVLINDASIADVFWGMYFIIIALVLLAAQHYQNHIQIIDVALVVLWGTRLALHIGKRKIGKPEDWRYSKWRKDWGKWFVFRSLAQNFLFQAVIALIISLSTIVIAHSVIKTSSSIYWWQVLAIGIWLFGFLFEVIGDWQLSRFLKTRTNNKTVLSKGLWRYTRHPNYFGEVTQWWALWLLCISYPYSFIAIASPILITYLILYVSGVPLLEKKSQNNPEYQKYALRTSRFVPLKPKKEQI